MSSTECADRMKGANKSPSLLKCKIQVPLSSMFR